MPRENETRRSRRCPQPQQRMKIKFLLLAVTMALAATLSPAADLSAWEQRLGPAAPDDTGNDRPAHFMTPAIPFPNGPARVNPYQLGTPNADAADYWSDSGQVAYVPDG